MAFSRLIERGRSFFAHAHELWLWFGTLQPAAAVAFGSFAVRERARGGGSQRDRG